MAGIRTVRPSNARGPLLLEEFSLGDIESVRLLLQGGSVIDWYQLNFTDHSDVDRFLRINEFDPESPAEMARLDELRAEAVDYLQGVFQFTIPEEVAYEIPARDLFLIASRKGKYKRWACIVLKVMHICNHLAGREAMVRLPIADDKIFHATELKVIEVVEELRAAGIPITDFEWSRKPHDSLITKLLAKRSTLAANIYDKLRFRLLVATYDDLVPMLAVLTRQLIPFNYVVPGESINGLVSLEEIIASTESLAPLASSLQPYVPTDDGDDEERPTMNEFSGSNYRIINFVTDLPLRLESLVPPEQIPPNFGHVTFVLTEFQIADKQTALNNDSGEANHTLYKARQRAKVMTRLLAHPEEEIDSYVPVPPFATGEF